MTKEYIANVYMTKEVEKDNYDAGCHGGISAVCDDKFTLEFGTKQDLLNQLAEWTASRFDVTKESFLEHVENECDKNRFDYAQGEDADGRHTIVTKNNPNGYYAMYFYHVSVSKKVSYSF